MIVPIFTTMDSIGTPIHVRGAAAAHAPAALTMSLRAFHLLFIALSVVLAAFFAAWAIGQYRVEPAISSYARAGVASLAARRRRWRSTARRSSGRRGSCRESCA